MDSPRKMLIEGARGGRTREAWRRLPREKRTRAHWAAVSSLSQRGFRKPLVRRRTTDGASWRNAQPECTLKHCFALRLTVIAPTISAMKDAVGDANFPHTADGRVYHLGLKRGEIANRVLTVGKPH